MKKIAESIATVHTHTHTGVLDNNKNNEIYEEKDIYKNASSYDAKRKLKNGLTRKPTNTIQIQEYFKIEECYKNKCNFNIYRIKKSNNVGADASVRPQKKKEKNNRAGRPKDAQPLQMAEYNLGITLIALIITIIVLLILAGVTLNMIMGENGIIKKAQISKEKTNEAQIEEEKNLQSLENKVNDYNTREQITIEKEEYEKLKKKGTWELLASTTSQNETELDVKDLNQYNSVILICYNSYNNLVASTEISVDLLKKQGENSFFVNYNNTAPYVAYCYYKSDTSVVMRCVNNSTTKAELYGIY